MLKKQLFRWAVMGMCLAALLSLLGCNKNKFILDGPGMERVVGWKSFTISRCSERYEPIYSYTVVYDSASCKAYLYCGTYRETEERTGIQLESHTINALFNLELLALPDEAAVTGNFLSLAVVDENGLQIPKKLSTAKEAEILALIRPYVDEGGSAAEQKVWQEFTVSQTSDVYEDNFSYTVTNESDGYYLFYEYFDYENKVPEDCKIRLKESTANALLSMNLLSLPDEQTIESSSDEETILDGTFAKFTITDENGNTYKKRVSDKIVQEIRSLLSTYIKD